jgi:recombination protein RecT
MHQSQQVPQQPSSPQQMLKGALEKAKPEIVKVLPPQLPVDRLFKVVLGATGRNESILKCTIPSILKSVLQAAELGLEIGGQLGEAYLVPFEKRWKDDQGRWHSQTECQCIIGYQGLLKLARNSGQISSISAQCVYSRDHFEIDFGDNRVVHKLTGIARGDLVAVYMQATLKSGERILEFMTFDQVEAIRKRSKTYSQKEDKSFGPWSSDYEMMSRKTVLRRGLRFAPRSSTLSDAIETDIQEDIDATETVASLPQQTQTTRAAQLAAAVRRNTTPQPDSTPELHGEVVSHDPQTGEVLEGVKTGDVAPSANADEGP